MNQSERRQFLINELIQENPRYQQMQIPKDIERQKRLLRALMNVRIPKYITERFQKVQDEYLQEEIKQKGITDIEDLDPVQNGIYIWQGDITTLHCDVIVNAANSGMTGCYVPNHRCIDNCIHTFSGIQLRLDCAEMMEKQGYAEPMGRARLTSAYNLPCKYILHTVGPIITGELSKKDCELLESCYHSCLETASKARLESIAFCCISTGEFHFPNEEAAKIAVKSVKTFLKKETSVKKVVFNVFKDTDKEIYDRLLRTD